MGSYKTILSQIRQLVNKINALRRRFLRLREEVMKKRDAEEIKKLRKDITM